ncbi:inositol polyphosphate-4-phosphatase type I A-like isoform X2 [Ischnura elegans]|uniref:inositol polyphosphate-4-phosphatase type I A-like isoform X2 n=1 Tax=Ischnura elegans TaxID=197161 RepID=UPI001ED8AAA0|nr:inositol polyphosphate-4-phosphatase type I A-like isoform X2 [Ischnura elegans]
MRFNKQELITLAVQPSQKFDKEGILFLRERQEGFFRRTERNESKRAKRSHLRELSCYRGTNNKVSTERWCRLRGNLLFYLKGREQWSEPAGLIVLEQCTVRIEEEGEVPVPAPQGQGITSPSGTPTTPTGGNGAGHGELFYYPFILVFDGGSGQQTQQLGALSEEERDGWVRALRHAGHDCVRARLLSLRHSIEALRLRRRGSPQPPSVTSLSSALLSPSVGDLHLDIHAWRLKQGTTLDPSEVPLCEVSLSCDNLLCDGHGRPPNPMLLIHAFIPLEGAWVECARTEVVERSSNPVFLSTALFRASEGLGHETKIRISAYDVRERLSRTATPLGAAVATLGSLWSSGRSRLPLRSPHSPCPPGEVVEGGAAVGFVTASVWVFEMEEEGESLVSGGGGKGSHESTPVHSLPESQPVQTETAPGQPPCHRRSLSLPPRLNPLGGTSGVWGVGSRPGGGAVRLPAQSRNLPLLHANATIHSFRLHSGLGGDISVHEMMAESRLCFAIPRQLLALWMQEEKELLQEVAGVGELREPWRGRQLALLDRHLHLLRLYSHAKQSLEAHAGVYFKASSRKEDRSLEFAPVNLHLQRMWAQNESLGTKGGVLHVVTVGAFAAHCHPKNTGGLLQLLHKLKESAAASNGDICQGPDKIAVAYDAVQAIKQLRREVVEGMRSLMGLAGEKRSAGMIPISEDMIRKTRTLLSLWDPGLVEEALAFVEENKVSPTGAGPAPMPGSCCAAEDSSGCHSNMRENEAKCKNGLEKEEDENKEVVLNNHEKSQTKLQDNLIRESLALKMADFLPKDKMSLDLQSPDGLTTPDSPRCIKAFWNTQNQSSHQTCMSQSQISSSPGKSSACPGKESEVNEVKDSRGEDRVGGDMSESEGLEPEGRRFLDTQAMCSSPSANYYRPTEEPEPWDLTQLNIEASMMCLVSKVKFLCGRCSSPALRLRERPKPMSVPLIARGSGTGPRVKALEANPLNNSGLPVVTEQPKGNGEMKTVDTDGPGQDSSLENQALLGKASLSDGAEKEHDGESLSPGSPAAKEVEFEKDECVEPEKSVLLPKTETLKNGDLKSDKSKHVTISTPGRNKFTEGLDLGTLSDWRRELRPSMRKLRQAMDGLLKTARLTHSVFRLREDPMEAQKACSIRYRRDVCFSQALTALIAGLMARLWCEAPDPGFIMALVALGPLACFEGLLGRKGAGGDEEDQESDMWGDMAVAVEDLSTVTFRLVAHRPSSQGPESSSSRTPMPRVSGSRAALAVSLPVPDSLLSRVALVRTGSGGATATKSFRVTPVFFDVGIHGWVEASAAGTTGVQSRRPEERSNADNFERLHEYYHRYRKLRLPPEEGRRPYVAALQPTLGELIKALRQSVQSSRPKNVEVLHLAASICRRMKGLRFTSCKSAKDRSGMSVTLEQVQVLATQYDLSPMEIQLALDCMRSEGCRRENLFKNTGSRRYAFSSQQMASLPKAYRPPPGTYGSGQT